MTPRRRIGMLFAIMLCVVLTVETITITVLYRTAMEENRARLLETARSQARLIEAVARFNKVHDNDSRSGAAQATLSQIRDAHSHYQGFGRTGEFTLSRKEDDQIVFLLSHRHYDLDRPAPVSWSSRLAEPMRLALSGKSGTVIGLDYRGEQVLAAHEPVGVLNLGIVAKIDLVEIRAPFMRAILLSGGFAILIILAGAGLFFRITEPILKRLQDTVERLATALKEVKTLRGIIPICSFCKKIRDDEGYWSQVEDYIGRHSDALFSHGLCPACLKQQYPEVYEVLEADKN